MIGGREGERGREGEGGECNGQRTASGGGRGRALSPPRPLVPMVGMVVTISPSFSLYRMVVLPAASSPTCGRGERGGPGCERKSTRPPLRADGAPPFSLSFRGAQATGRAPPPPFSWPPAAGRTGRACPQGGALSRERPGQGEGRVVTHTHRGGRGEARALPLLVSTPARAEKAHAPLQATTFPLHSALSHHQDAHLLLGEQSGEQLGEGEAHGCKETRGRARQGERSVFFSFRRQKCGSEERGRTTRGRRGVGAVRCD